MPPRGHSSSGSHSSSSHSSSRSSSSSSRSSGSHSSSSSFRSSSSYSSSSRSYGSSRGPSRHSTTSHYTGLQGGTYHGNHQPSYSMPRSRTNQPTGYQVSKDRGAPREYHCKNHDYVYFPAAWDDHNTGIHYQKGYYDENGNWYEDVVIRDKQTGEAKFVCQYCGTEVRTKWTEGIKPTCPNCSAQMEEAVTDELSESVSFSQRMRIDSSERSGFGSKIIILLVTAFVSLGLFSALPGFLSNDPEPSSYVQTYQDDSIYVEEIGRTCWADPETGDYYDPDTDCWFWYNDTIDFPAWQYWYEGISSDFGDYGWMEYHEDEQQWYIEQDHADWIPLPEEYFTDYLWHIAE